MNRNLIFFWTSLWILSSLGGCTSVFFLPTRDHLFSVDEAPVPIAEYQLSIDDKQSVHVWVLTPKTEVKARVIYLHGNAGNLSSHVPAISWFLNYGFELVAFDYRGYGKSKGSASVANSEEDLLLVLDRFASGDSPVVLFGQSLGGSIALRAGRLAAVRKRSCAMVLDSAFSQYQGIAQEKLSSFFLTWPLQWPLSLLFRIDPEPIDSLPFDDLVPLILLHDSDDRVVPVSHSQLIFERAAEPKQLWQSKGRGHIGFLAAPEEQRRLAAHLLEIQGCQLSH